MKIYVMRHGQTIQNSKSHVQGGGSDSPLTNKGIDGAKKAKTIIDELSIQRIYSGDLGRHLQTVSIINSNNIEHIIDPNLNEANFGCYENKPIWYMYIKTFITNKCIVNPKTLSISYIMDCIKKSDKTKKVESSIEIKQRINKTMSNILNCGLERILIVSSGMYLETMIEMYNPNIKFMRMKNCGIYLLDTDNSLKICTVYE